MANYYYGEELLPQVPQDVVSANPYYWIRKGSSSYSVMLAPHPWYVNSGMVYIAESCTNYVYTLPIGGTEWTLSNTYNDEGGFGSTGQIVIFTSHNIPSGSPTSSTIWIYGSEPVPENPTEPEEPETVAIELVNQNQSSSNNTNSCSLTMNNCTIGNTLILAYVVRGVGNNPTLSDGWVKLGGGNNVSDATGVYQKLYFATKKVTSATETITLTQTTTGRIYLVCSEYANVNSVIMRNDLASYGSINYTANGAKSNVSDAMVYGVTSAYYGSGMGQTINPNDLTKIKGDTDTERLACWFDDGSGALEHTFSTWNGTGAYDAVLECVQLFGGEPISKKYLVRSNNTLYTVVDGTLSALGVADITAEVFRQYGVDEMPSGDLLKNLGKFELLFWQDSTEYELPTFTALVTATPTSQNVISQKINLAHDTIKGIEKMTAVCEGELICAVSFDNKATWKMYNGGWQNASEFSGMNKATLEAITTEQWAELFSGANSLYIRITLNDASQSVTSIQVDFAN